MADVWVVLAHFGSGVVVGAYSTLALAQTVVGSNPSMSYEIVQCTIDGESSVQIPQKGIATPAGAANMLPNRNRIKVGKQQ